MLRRVLIAGFRRVVRLYFRAVERAGVPPDAETRGRVIVSNHQNALIDPILVMTDAADCAIAPLAKSTLWSIPVLRWLLDLVDAVPVVRRVDRPDKAAGASGDLFAAAARHLEGGGNLLIFPEGTSHSGPKLAPVRSGAARMLLAADGARAAEPLTFQAAALEFEHPDIFRSRCLILWGPVRRVDDVAGAGDLEARVAAVTAQIQADLAALLVSGETHDEKLLVARVARLIAHDLGDATLGTWSEIGRRVQVAHALLRDLDRERVARVRRAVDAYHAELAHLGARDEQVAAALDGARGAHRLRLALCAPLALVGAILYGLPYVVPRRIARSADLDARSTYKLASALVIYPLWMGGLVAASFTFLPPGLKLAGAAVAITSPFAALAWLDALDDRGRTLAPADLRRVCDLRAAAVAEITAARATAGL